MRLALYQPDIPQNTGTLMRLCACLDVPLDIIGPTGFDMSDKALRRAGMDYLDHLKLTKHLSYDAFLDTDQRHQSRLILTTTRTEQRYTDFTFQPEDILLLGRESSGVPPEVVSTVDAAVTIPMAAELRSLNIAVAGAMILGEALRQTEGFSKA